MSDDYTTQQLELLLPEATRRLRSLMRHRDGHVALKAIREIFDRTKGRPSQPDAPPQEIPSLGWLHLLACRQVAEQLEAERQAALGKPKASNGTNGTNGTGKRVIDYEQPALE